MERREARDLALLLLRKASQDEAVVRKFLDDPEVAGRITSADVAKILGLSGLMARVLLKAWLRRVFLEIMEPSKRWRAYSLSAICRQIIGKLKKWESHPITPLHPCSGSPSLADVC